MRNERRDNVLRLLARIEQDIADVQQLTVEPHDDDTLLRTSQLLQELRDSLAGVERLIRLENERPSDG